MFTGIIRDVGRVARTGDDQGGRDLVIETALDTADWIPGASVSCSGCCMTVVNRGAGWFSVHASAETLSKTTLGQWVEGYPVNLEPSLRLGDELGGHIVSGHVDGLAELLEIRADGPSRRLTIRAPSSLSHFVASKGSVALDGVSLTVNEVSGDTFGVNLIPYTLEHTSFSGLKAGMKLNMEADMLARYAARILGREAA